MMGESGHSGVDRGVVHVIDDDEPVRQAIELLLLSAGYSAQAHRSGVAFLEALADLNMQTIGCVLTDVRMPGLDGISLLIRLRKIGFMHPVIVMTALGDITTAVQAMKAGAEDFIEKPFDDEALLGLIAAALVHREAGRAGASAPEASPLPERSTEAIRQIAALSAREREVLDLLAAGKPNKLVAYELGISQRTVEMHRARLMGRLGVRSLAEAVRIAVRVEMSGDDLPAAFVVEPGGVD